MEIHSLPILSSINECPKDGTHEKKFIFCERNYNNNCKDFYKRISSIEGFHVCPYGFSSFCTIVNSKLTIFTSLEVEKHYDRKKIKKNKKKDFGKKRYTVDEILQIIKSESAIYANINAKKNILHDYDNKVLKVTQKKEVLDDTLHELRKLNNVLKKQSFLLKSELEKRNPSQEELMLRSKNINATSQLVSARLNAYDFTLNPEIIETNPPTNISLYRKFEKARHCLEVITKELSINIIFTGSSKQFHNCFEIIDVLPFILLENAIKFNYNKQPIECLFNEEAGNLKEIIVKNKAILPKKEELNSLKMKHFRSENTDSITGTGKGLYIASLICEYHNIDMTIETNQKEIIDCKCIGDFIVKLNTTTANTRYS